MSLCKSVGNVNVTLELVILYGYGKHGLDKTFTFIPFHLNFYQSEKVINT